MCKGGKRALLSGSRVRAGILKGKTSQVTEKLNHGCPRRLGCLRSKSVDLNVRTETVKKGEIEKVRKRMVIESAMELQLTFSSTVRFSRQEISRGALLSHLDLPWWLPSPIKVLARATLPSFQYLMLAWAIQSMENNREGKNMREIRLVITGCLLTMMDECEIIKLTDDEIGYVFREISVCV